MIAAESQINESDLRILALFESAGTLETPTPGVRAWLANDSSGGRKPVLIKRLAGGRKGKGRATEALALQHPNIVRVRRWLVQGDNLYVVRDVVRGKNLRQTLSTPGRALTNPETLRRYILPVIDALEYAHGRGIVHGGISQENILVAADDGRVVVCDFGTADPRSPHHFHTYGGILSIAGDVKALGKLIAENLPTEGPFASIVVRGRVEGVIGRCDTLTDLRETLDTLEKLASAPTGNPLSAATADDLKPFADPQGDHSVSKVPVPDPHEARLTAAPSLSTQLGDRTPFIIPGGGGSATLIVRNEGAATLIVRMVATQHAWLNVRPVELPLTIPAGGSAPIGFFISAARLTPGEYRSEVYLSANAGGRSAEDLRGGWFKHTSEIRVTVGTPTGVTGGGSAAAPPYPSDAPKLPAVSGCAPAALLFIVAIPTARFLLETIARSMHTLPSLCR